MRKIDTCKKCTNRKFDRNQGIVCGLTGVKPTFEETCPDFVVDEKVKKSESKFIRPNDSRAKTAMLLVGLVLLFEIISLFSDYSQFRLLKSSQGGGQITNSMIENNDLRQSIIGILYFVIYVISGITFILWFRRGYYNLHQRIKYCSQKEHWATSSWFVPIICLYRPFQIMKEMWTESSDLIKKHDNNYTHLDNASIIGWWWTLWIISAFIGNFILRYGFNSETVSELTNYTIANMILSLIGIPLAILTIRMIKSYSNMETVLQEKEKEENN